VNDATDISSLLVMRKLTRAISTTLRDQLAEHIKALTPVLRPELTFGKFIQGGHKEWVVKSDQALKDLRALYDRIAPTSPYNLRIDLTPPLDLGGLSLELNPVEYTHVVQQGTGSRNIGVRRPLTWTLSYGGFSPQAFKRVLDSRMRSPNEVQRFVLATLALHLVMTMQPGLANLLRALRFPVTTATDPGFGELPLTRISVALTTERPSDSVIIESAEVTGMDAFEELVKLDDIRQWRDPMRDQLLEIARQHVPDVVPS
jgi:hypothetical protein